MGFIDDLKQQIVEAVKADIMSELTQPEISEAVQSETQPEVSEAVQSETQPEVSEAVDISQIKADIIKELKGAVFSEIASTTPEQSLDESYARICGYTPEENGGK